MIVKTSRFGDKEVPDESLIIFPEGVIGFQDAKRFVMFECTDDGLFKWLQSADRPDLAFVVAEAGTLFPNYRVAISEKERRLLEIERPEEAVVCLILIIPSNPLEATANLLGPLIFNTERRLGMQAVLVNPEYSTRQRLFQQAGEASTSPAPTPTPTPAPSSPPSPSTSPAAPRPSAPVGSSDHGADRKEG